MVYDRLMSVVERPVRQSVSLPPKIAKRVKALARSRQASANRVIVDLIQEGLESAENERRRFLDLADQLSAATDPAERRRLKAELARMTFGE
ncbi:MAG: hypothetical protein HY648_08350 [Acidobacteria bacterium]|nr:hypothetical protein [Acidobacteriota bacterium]